MTSSSAAQLLVAPNPRVVVVGAGFAGVAAAEALREGGVEEVLILEAQDRPGGRVQKVELEGGFAEPGAQFIHGEKGNKLYELAQQYGLLLDASLYRDEGKSKDSSAADYEYNHFYTSRGERLNQESVTRLIRVVNKVFRDYANSFFAESALNGESKACNKREEDTTAKQNPAGTKENRNNTAENEKSTTAGQARPNNSHQNGCNKKSGSAKGDNCYIIDYSRAASDEDGKPPSNFVDVLRKSRDKILADGDEPDEIKVAVLKWMEQWEYTDNGARLADLSLQAYGKYAYLEGYGLTLTSTGLEDVHRAFLARSLPPHDLLLGKAVKVIHWAEQPSADHREEECRNGHGAERCAEDAASGSESCEKDAAKDGYNTRNGNGSPEVQPEERDRQEKNGKEGSPGKENGREGSPGKEKGKEGSPGKENGREGSPGKENGREGSPGKEKGKEGSPGKENGREGSPGKEKGKEGSPGKEKGKEGSPGKEKGKEGSPGKLKRTLSQRSQSEKNKAVRVLCEDGEEFWADHVIVTSSIGYLKRHEAGMFKPQLPEKCRRALHQMGFSTVAKVFLVWDSLEGVLDTGVEGIQFLWLDTHHPHPPSDRTARKTSKGGNWYDLLQGFETIPSHKGTLLTWLAGEEADIMEELPEREVKDVLYDLLVQFTDNKNLPRPKHIIRSQWHSNPYILGGYSYIPADMDPESHNLLSEPLPSQENPVLQLSGEATSPRFYSSVHGAIDSGQRAACSILRHYKLTS